MKTVRVSDFSGEFEFHCNHCNADWNMGIGSGTRPGHRPTKFVARWDVQCPKCGQQYALVMSLKPVP